MEWFDIWTDFSAFTRPHLFLHISNFSLSLKGCCRNFILRLTIRTVCRWPFSHHNRSVCFQSGSHFTLRVCFHPPWIWCCLTKEPFPPVIGLPWDIMRTKVMVILFQRNFCFWGQYHRKICLGAQWGMIQLTGFPFCTNIETSSNVLFFKGTHYGIAHWSYTMANIF